MNKRIQTIIIAMMAIVGNASAQTLSVRDVEVQTDGQTELIVTLSGVASGTTALQFNLHLPEGVTLEETAITKGSAVSGHTLDICPLSNGNRLFVFYNTDMALITNGELLHLPISTGSEAGTLKGSIYLVRTATTDAVSQPCSGSSFSIMVKEPELPVTITANNLTITYGDDLPMLTYKSEGAELNGTPSLTTTATKTSPVGTYPITVTKGTVTNEQVTYVAGTLTITKAPLTVGVKDETITEGDAIPVFTLTYDGFRNNDTEATAFTKKPEAKTKATQSSPAGTYSIKVSGGEAQNYSLSYGQGILTIEAGISEGISSVEADEQTTPRYNLAGQKVNAQYKGITIQKGKKVMK